MHQLNEERELLHVQGRVERSVIEQHGRHRDVTGLANLRVSPPFLEVTSAPCGSLLVCARFGALHAVAGGRLQ
jgi:hypothetical protein